MADGMSVFGTKELAIRQVAVEGHIKNLRVLLDEKVHELAALKREIEKRTNGS